MQELSAFFRQLRVLIARNFQLIFNNKLVLASLLLQAPLMVGVIALVGDPDCFTSNLIDVGSRTVLFILAAVSSFMGLLNSYREICKEREIIFREASVGVSLGATVLAKMVTLALISLVQAAILTAGFVRVMLDTDFELYITVLLILLSSASMGLLVSAAFKNSESAILFVLVLIIAQVVFSGALFPVSGAMTAIGYLVTCRWGMGAFGASTDLNSRLVWLNVGLDSPMYNATVPNLIHCWQMLGLLSVVCLIAAWLVLKIGFARRKG